jgi:hypothetical protein
VTAGVTLSRVWHDREPSQDEWRTAPAALQRALLERLVARGSPRNVASELAAELETASQRRTEWARLRGMVLASSVESEEDREDVTREHVTGLAENLADDNAEANDRTARGESGYDPLWPLPDRTPRR